MKKVFTLSILMILAFNLNAQRGGSYSYNYSNYGYGSYYYNSGYGDGYENYDRRDRRYNRNYRNKNRRYGISFYDLRYVDQKRLKKLNRKLEKAERKAWRDNYLSRRERKCLRDIENDIDRIWLRYVRNNGNNNICGNTYYGY